MDSKTKEILQKFSAQKVELALELGGIRSMSKKLKGDIKTYNKKFSVLDDLVRDLSNEAQGLDKRTEKFYQEVQDIKKSGQRQAKDLGIKLGFITTTTPKTIAIIKEGLSNYIDFEDFDLITSNQLVKQGKPNVEIYEYALSKLKISANEAIAIEDTKANQSSANLCGIDCYLFPGEYATINCEDMLGKNFITEKLELSKILD